MVEMVADKTIDLDKRSVFISGLPRSGSTLLCQLLSHHGELYCPGYSSPLANTLIAMRERWSNDPFLLSQLEVDFDRSYRRLLNAYRGLLNGWFAETDKAVVVDKNRAWLGAIDAAIQVDPKCKFIVCVRELGQLSGSIESQHQKTVLLDSGEGTANRNPFGRVNSYFSNGGLVANCLASVESVIKDCSDDVRGRVFFMKFEDLVAAPFDTLAELWAFLEISPIQIDTDNLSSRIHEADSHYRFKFTHKTHRKVLETKVHDVPQRIQLSLESQYDWFYHLFYPSQLEEVA